MPIRRLLPAAVALSAAVVLSGCAGTADTDPAPPTPAQAGGEGIGDPYFPSAGNGGYDVEHYGLDVRYDPATDELAGTATVEAVATHRLAAFNLDLSGLTVRAVRLDGAATPWRREAGELTVEPAEPLPADGSFTVEVDYDGVPRTNDDVSGFMHTDDGALVAGQPDGAADWFPVNDHPRDAATVTVAVTVPEGLEALSNGRLDGSATTDGWTRWEWRAEEPMAPYLVTLAIGEFQLDEYEVDGVRYWDAVDPDLFRSPGGRGSTAVGETAEEALEIQPDVVAWLAELVGPYPFATAGGIVDDHEDMTFALETRTRPVYPGGVFDDAWTGEVFVVHEIAHQWFGNDVRIDGWQHIWLSEGIATYLEWLWAEEQGGASAQEQYEWLLALPEDDPAYEDLWTAPPGDPGPEGLFSGAVYQRGAMTHHALRLELGDADYFRLLRSWAGEHSGDAVTTEDFTELAEEVAGRDLDPFFDTWLFTPGRPDPLES